MQKRSAVFLSFQTVGNSKMRFFPKLYAGAQQTCDSYQGCNANPSLTSCRISTEAQCGTGDICQNLSKQQEEEEER